MHAPITTTYVYDGLGRLTSETKGEDSITYTYDANGNRIGMNQNGTVTTYAYDANNRLLSETVGDTVTVYTYDANGNTLTAGDKTYTYNTRGQQSGYSNGTTAAAYAYNPSGLRNVKTVGGSTKYFVYNGMNIVYEYSESVADGVTYFYGLNRTHNSEGEIYLYNAHGDVVQLVKNNAVVASYTYDAFGNLTSQIGESDNPFLYCGEYFDAETQTYYLRARYYNPANGRFTQQDAWAFMDASDPLSLNLYAYCCNNPVMYVDPSGHAVTEWDKRHLSEEELSHLQDMTDKWANASPLEQAQYRKIAEKYRSAYRMPYEFTDCNGHTKVDKQKMIDFQHEAYTSFSSGKHQLDYTTVFAAAGIASQIDTPAPGPGDVVAVAIIAVGCICVFAKGKSRPRDLEKGMSSYQKGMFQREIEDWKQENGMPPNYNLPWEILVALAETVKEMYRNK